MHKRERAQRDIRGMFAATLLIVVAAVALQDTTTMIDADSYIFPRVFAGAMMFFCMLFILLQYFRPSGAQGTEPTDANTPGSVKRRLGLVAVLIGNALAMPWLGFLLPGLVAFMLIMLLAMYDEWTFFRKAIFTLAGVAIVLGFYTLFTQVLKVPLPQGNLFSAQGSQTTVPRQIEKTPLVYMRGQITDLYFSRNGENHEKC